jgi:hypothetical protein
MKKVLLAVPVLAAVALAGCGGDAGCTSQPADIANNAIGRTCSAAPNTIAEIPVPICGTCASPSCPGSTFRRDPLDNSFFVDINPVVQECEENRGCGLDPGCTRGISCRVTVPADVPSDTTVDVLYGGIDVGDFIVSNTPSNNCGIASAALEFQP